MTVTQPQNVPASHTRSKTFTHILAQSTFITILEHVINFQYAVIVKHNIRLEVSATSGKIQIIVITCVYEIEFLQGSSLCSLYHIYGICYSI